MGNRSMELSIRLTGDGRGLEHVMAGARGSTEKTRGAFRRMASGITDDMTRLNHAMNGWSAATRLAAEAGGLYAVGKMITASAMLDKELTRIKHTGSMTATQIAVLRKELQALNMKTGGNFDDLKEGLDSAVQSGLGFEKVLPTLGAVNDAVAVAGGSAKTLMGGLTVAAATFKFDLSKPRMAVDLLDQMYVAGNLGNVELNNLSDVFARVGVNANSAGMGFGKTLGFVEALSQVEVNPERLATLVDSTLRVFTNKNYMKDAQQGAGIKFFDAQGSRRDAVDVLGDIKKKYDTLKTDSQRFSFISKAFGHADLDTIKGIRTLMDTNALANVTEFSNKIESASGAIARDLPDAINNAVDQTGRLSASLSAAADKFAEKINAAVTTPVAKFTADAVEQGDGMKLGALAAGGVGALIAGRLAWKKSREGKPGLLDQVLNRSGGGEQQVFVTNWPKGLLGPGESLKQKRERNGASDEAAGGSAPSSSASRGQRVKAGALGAFKYGAPLTAALSAYDAWGAYSDKELDADQKKQAYARIGGGATGSVIGSVVGGGIGALFGGVGAVPGAMIGGAIGNMLGEAAGESLSKKQGAAAEQKMDTGGTLTIKIDSAVPATVTSMQTKDPRQTLNVDSGLTMAHAR